MRKPVNMSSCSQGENPKAKARTLKAKGMACAFEAKDNSFVFEDP